MKKTESPLNGPQWAYGRQEQHNDDRVSFDLHINYTKYGSWRGMI